jgi:hypothetical protein
MWQWENLVSLIGITKTCLFLKICLRIVKITMFIVILRFCHSVFDQNYKATIGVDFEVERFDVLQVPFNLQM